MTAGRRPVGPRPALGRVRAASANWWRAPLSLGFGALILVAAVVAAASVGVRTVRDPEPVLLPAADPALVRAVSYLAYEEQADVLYVYEPDSGRPPVPLATFPRAFGVKAVGSAAPLGDRVAVLTFTSRGNGRLFVMPLSGGEVRSVEASFDFSTPMAWDAWGTRLALSRIVEFGKGGRRRVAVAELNLLSGELRDRAEFADVFRVAPVGYDARGTKLYVVTIDPTGSTLWAIDPSGARQRVAVLSAGPTDSWRLSPDRTQLAYVAVAGGEGTSSRGRVVTLASGQVVDIPAAASQVGAVWGPDSLMPQFGGPGGSVWIAGTDPLEVYLFPAAWSPDGSMLLTLVVDARREGAATLEIVTPRGRIPVTDLPAQPLGWVIAVD